MDITLEHEPIARLLSWLDWLKLPDDGKRHELVDGRLVVVPAPDVAHQRASAALHFQFQLHLRRRGEALASPIGLKLSPRIVREPDLLVVLGGKAKCRRGVVAEPPDLVVEILSPSTKRRDRGRKKRDYAAAGIPEYWLVDLRARAVEQYALRGPAYVLVATRRRKIAPLAAPALAIRLHEVFAAAAGGSSAPARSR